LCRASLIFATEGRTPEFGIHLISSEPFRCSSKTAEPLWDGDRSTLNALDAELQELYQGEENGPLLLAWMLLQYLGPDGDETFTRYRRFGLMATKLGVFSFLDKLLQEPMFKVWK